ncbi:hypothetical protein ACLFLE_13975 [Providencia vermicola]|uniref:hypothetical protein n=1 Tax=Providencia vermicola TaxID=333965 RepID=UPI003979A53D
MAIYSWNKATEHSVNHSTQVMPSTPHIHDAMQHGMVSELVYDEKHPIMDYILLWITSYCQCCANLVCNLAGCFG